MKGELYSILRIPTLPPTQYPRSNQQNIKMWVKVPDGWNADCHAWMLVNPPPVHGIIPSDTIKPTKELPFLGLDQSSTFVDHHLEPDNAQKPAYHRKPESPRVQLSRHLYSLEIGECGPGVVNEETMKPLASVCYSPANHITVSPHIHITPEKAELTKNDCESSKRFRKSRSPHCQTQRGGNGISR